MKTLRTIVAVAALALGPCAATGPILAAAPTDPPAAGAGVPPAAALVPAAGEGLVRQGNPSTYAGDQLFDFIDGGAPQYMEYGFAEAVSQEIAFHGRTYIFDVYRMVDALAAYGVWSVRHPQRCTPLETLPFSCVVPPQAMLVHGPYYVEISAYQNVPETVAEMAELARRGFAGVDSSVVESDLLRDAPFTALPGADRVAGSEKLARGPVSLRTGLGREASGPLGTITEVLSPSALAAFRMPIWLIAGYHAKAADDPGSAATTVIVLVGGAKTDEFWRAARGALPPEAKVASILPNVWLAVHEAAGQSIFGVMRGNDLVLGASRLPADALEAWVGQVTAKPGQP